MLRLVQRESDHRFYAVKVYTDLLGDVVVLHTWRSLTSRRGGTRLPTISGLEEAERLVEAAAKQHHARCYRLVEDRWVPPASQAIGMETYLAALPFTS